LFESSFSNVQQIKKGDKDILPYLDRTMKNMQDLDNLTTVISTTLKTRKNISLLLLVNIFCTIEGSLTFLINIIIYVLIQEHHHDIWDQIHQKFVTSYDDISSISLNVKIKFLEKHGLKFIDKFARRDIRNAFAHQNYTIDDDGKMTIFKKQKKVSELTMENLLEISTNIQKLLDVNTKIYVSYIDISFEEFTELMENVTLEDFMEIADKLLEDK